jgi:hypothetical protein
LTSLPCGQLRAKWPVFWQILQSWCAAGQTPLRWLSNPQLRHNMLLDMLLLPDGF